MKKLIAPLLVLVIMMSPLLCLPLAATAMAVFPIFDLPGETLPRNCRILNRPVVNESSFNLLGLDELKASGSGQFSEETFAALMNALPLQSEQLIIFDLREESHGFVNGLPVCWTDGLFKYTNVNKTCEEIERDELERVTLALDAGYLVIEPSKTQTEQIELIVSEAMTERAFVEGTGYTYIRFPVTNHNRPNDQTVDQFVQFVNSLSSDQWVHFHCRAGKGRTTTFLTLLDIIKNGHQVSVEDILTRQQLIGGSNLKEFGSKKEPLKKAAQKRLDFIHAFYAYCQQVPDFSIPWSEWVQQQNSQKVFSNKENAALAPSSFDETVPVSSTLSSPIFNPVTHHQSPHAQKMNAPTLDVFKVLPTVKGSGSVEIGITIKDNGKDTKWELHGKGEVHDSKGNYVEVDGRQRSDGTREVGINGGKRGK